MIVPWLFCRGVVVFRFRRWWLLCGAVLVGVAALNGVVDAKAAPARGAVCVRVGAKALDGVSGRGLVCVQTKVRGLRWRFAPTTVTTSPSTSATTTVTAANVAPRVVSASAVTGNAVITIDDMSPDMGVYAVQWVPVGQDFNSFSMYRTTTKTMTVPYLSCTRTYTLRVFVMQANWQMTDGFVNQNVTPHSATFDLTMPACSVTATAATTTTVALTCAQGGSCAVGDTGPGGGLVFYVHDDADDLFTCGATLASTCKYLEVAPNTWDGGSADPTKLWAVDDHQSSDIAEIANDSTAYNDASGIGLGYKNSEAIVLQGNDTTTAAGAARAYGGGSKSDWYLPTTAELNLLCQWARDVVQSVTTPCTGGTLNTGTGAGGGFSADAYWSSSEYAASNAWLQNFFYGSQGSSFKRYADCVRPVRAFG